MPVTRHPPHRSVRALLTHTALIGIFGVKPIQRIRMNDSWFGQIPAYQSLDSLPRPPAALTAPPQRKQPVSRRLPPERIEPLQVSRNRVIVEVSSHHLCQPVAGLLNRIVHSPAQFGCNIAQLCCHAFPNRLALYRKLAALMDRAADMSEAQKVERLWFPRP